MTDLLDLSRPRRVHLVGIGGAGMSGLARILLMRGHTVSGSDLHQGRALPVLQEMGARIHVPHSADALGDAEVVVRSNAVPDANPEIVAAVDRGLPVLPRAHLLAALMEGSTRVLVAGTHGKTTTTSMLTVALQSADVDPSYAIGGQLNETGSNAMAGGDPVFIAEADESDRSFLVYTSDVAIVTNIELDHPDEYVDDDDVDAVFLDFLSRRAPGGVAVVCLDDPGVRRLLPQMAPPVVTYGTDPEADVRLLVDESGARVRTAGEDRDVVALQLAVPGHHNLLNATAAIAALQQLGAEPAAGVIGLRRFGGVVRRFQTLGEERGVLVVDDYAHHPTELAATLAAARQLGRDRIVLVVQPHRYSRTQALGGALGRAAAVAEVVVVTDVYASSEAPVPGVSGQLVAAAASSAGSVVHYEPHLAEVAKRLAEIVRPGDLVLVTGAGDVTQVGPELLGILASDG